jgi:hypothetical protein
MSVQQEKKSYQRNQQHHVIADKHSTSTSSTRSRGISCLRGGIEIEEAECKFLAVKHLRKLICRSYLLSLDDVT